MKVPDDIKFSVIILIFYHGIIVNVHFRCHNTCARANRLVVRLKRDNSVSFSSISIRLAKGLAGNPRDRLLLYTRIVA